MNENKLLDGVVPAAFPSGDDETIWGARDIGVVIGREERITFYMLEKGFLPARKVGGVG